MEVRLIWLQLPELLTHRHLWVRKAASRLLGLAFADSSIGERPTLACTFFASLVPTLLLEALLQVHNNHCEHFCEQQGRRQHSPLVSNALGEV